MLISGVLFVASCQHHPAPGESVEEVCSPANDGKSVSVSGYLASPGFMLCSDTCQLAIRARKDDRQPALTINVPVGDGSNQVAKLPERFKVSDLRVQDHAGKKVGHLSPVRATGKALIRGGSCQLVRLEKIEKL